MPLYDYQCSACGHEMEALQKMSDAPLTNCPACHSASLKKKVTAAAFRLSGSGWYETDFKSGDKKNLKESAQSEDKKSSKKETPAAPTTPTTPKSSPSTTTD